MTDTAPDKEKKPAQGVPELPAAEPSSPQRKPWREWRIIKIPCDWWNALKDNANTNRVITVATIVIALSAVAQIFVTGAQWQEMRSGGRDTQTIADASDSIELAIRRGNRQNRAAFEGMLGQSEDAMNKTLAEMEKQSKAMQDAAVATSAGTDVAKGAADTAAKQLELSERPWVDAQIVINGPFEFNVNGPNIHLGFTLLNAGHLPALTTVVEAIPVDSISTGAPQPTEYVGQECRATDDMIRRFPAEGIALFPNIPFQSGRIIGLNTADLAKNHGPGSRMPGVILLPSVVLCIGYRPTFNSAIYHTAYIFQLTYVDASNKPSATFKIGEDIPQAQMRMQFTYIDAN